MAKGWCARGVAAFLAAFLLAQTSVAFSQTMISGAITADAHWTAEASPFLVTGDVAVRNGATVIIDAGVTIFMGAGASVAIDAGAIRANGTASEIIRVVSDQVRLGQAPAPGDWNRWVFNPGATNVQLDHVLFEHGRGLAVFGSAPVLNYLDIRNHQGAAVSVDLAASPSGIGNRASGNSLNGIAVPAGDITGVVSWGLRGIPYIVQSGIVSVGASPQVASITPSTIERDQTTTVTLTGARLGGLSSAKFDGNGITATPFAGGSASQVSLQVKADALATLGSAALRVQVDAGEIVVPNALTITQPMPGITSLSPSAVVAGEGASEIVITGRNFTTQSEALFNSAAVPTQYVSGTQLRSTLPNQTAAATLPVQVRTPDPLNAGQHLLSNTANLTVKAPVPPDVSFEPTPIALPPDGKAHEVTLRLSKADFRDHTLLLSISDTSKATLTPASIVIPAGQTSAKVAITPVAAGVVTVQAQSETLGTTTVPLYITTDFKGVNTSYAAPVGVVVEGVGVQNSVPVTVANPTVGVSVGAVLTNTAPRGWSVGSSQTIVVSGAGVPAGAQVALTPSTGATVGPVSVAEDGSSLSFEVTAAQDAQPGPRKLQVSTASGAALIFADAAQSVLELTAGQPRIESVTPLVTTVGSTVKLTVRGEHLHGARVVVTPAEGIEVDSQPTVDATGTELTAMLRITAAASLGVKTVQIVTPSGATSAQTSHANSFQVVGEIGATLSPIASPMVGVTVGDAVATTLDAFHASQPVGVVVGAAISEVVPRSGVVGNQVAVSVRGTGLQGVVSLSMTPSTGLTLGGYSVNAEGTQLDFTVAVDAAAAPGPRRLMLATATGALPFMRPDDGTFLVTVPLPEVASVEPQVVRVGTNSLAVTLRGANFANVSGVRLAPAEGVVAGGPYTASADGSMLTFVLTVDAAAAPTTRTVIVTTAAGESSGTAGAGNTLRLAREIGATYDAIASPVVGVVLEREPVPASFDGIVAAAAVGVSIEVPAVEETVQTHAVSGTVGLLVGSAALDLSPSGWLQGASGNIVVSGRGLGAVTAVSVTPAEGVLLGAVAANQGGTELTLPVAVAPDAPLVPRRLRLATATGEIAWVDSARALFGVGILPSLSSISPIVIERGKAVTLTMRGTNLKGVTDLTLAPNDGVSVIGVPVWAQDGLGESLTVGIYVNETAQLGERVVQLHVPGGLTSAVPASNNVVRIVNAP